MSPSKSDTLKFTSEIRVIFQDSKGNYWLGSHEEGVSRFNGKSSEYFTTSEGLSDNQIRSVQEDKNGTIWFGTYRAVFEFKGNQFIEEISNETLGLNSETGQLHVRSVFKDSEGRLWIGNNRIGVLLKEEDSIINFSEQNNLIHPASLRSGAKSLAETLEHVFAIEEDADGNSWFGDRETGAWKYDGTTVTNYVIDKKLKSQMIWSIYSDNDNNLLFEMAEGGVYTFNGKSFDNK